MIIKLKPQRRDDNVTIIKSGDTITINGQAFDFSVIPDGATLPAEAVECEWIAGEIHRFDGELTLSLILPHGPNPSQAVAFPADIVNPADGPLELPQ